MSSYYTYTIEWPSVDTNQIQSIQITGSFDNWARSLPAKTSFEDGYKQVVKVDSRQKLVFKFVINGNDWVTNNHYKIEHDDSGISNNVIEAAELTEFHEFEEEPEPVQPVPLVATTEEPVITKATTDEVVSEKAAPEATEETAPSVADTKTAPSVAKTKSSVVPEQKTTPLVAETKTPLAPEPSAVAEPKASKTLEPALVASVLPVAPVAVNSPVPVEEEPVPSKDVPVIVSPAAPKATEDDILSDLDDAPKDHLTQVLTSSSSFAAVSIPSSHDDANDFEHLASSKDTPVAGTSNHDDVDVDDQFNTPTNSLFNSTVLNQSAHVTPNSVKGGNSTADTSIINSRNSSFAGGNKPNLLSQNSDATLNNTKAETEASEPVKKNDKDVVEILKAPGGYPPSPERTASSTPTKEAAGKRDTLISRFKGLFKY
ncbi:uncharacterized protein RJT20DRAFT_125773 [Scheffersomyces xylosifermentans]|uniref:uncharacterized protein n=1 Tax=Scheffersomyces xylosifermentans TaxID=1304137 RepID=UPI00315CB5F4